MNRAERRRAAREQGWRGNKSGARQLSRETAGGIVTTRIAFKEALENAEAERQFNEEREKAQEAAKLALAAKHMNELGFVLPGQF